MCFYPTSSFGKLHTYALHYSQHNACEFSNNLITYKSDNLTFNDNSLCKSSLISLYFFRMQLEGQVAIITGGARGIGKAIAEALLKEKVKVIYY